jgi:hypothetical protein
MSQSWLRSSWSRIYSTSSKIYAHTQRPPFGPVLTTIKVLAAAHLFLDHIAVVKATWGPSMLPTIDAFDNWVLISRMHKKGRGVEVGVCLYSQSKAKTVLINLLLRI